MPKCTTGTNRLEGNLTDRIAKTYYEASHVKRRWKDANSSRIKGRNRRGADAVRKMLMKNADQIVRWLREVKKLGTTNAKMQ